MLITNRFSGDLWCYLCRVDWRFSLNKLTGWVCYFSKSPSTSELHWNFCFLSYHLLTKVKTDTHFTTLILLRACFVLFLFSLHDNAEASTTWEFSGLSWVIKNLILKRKKNPWLTKIRIRCPDLVEHWNLSKATNKKQRCLLTMLHWEILKLWAGCFFQEVLRRSYIRFTAGSVVNLFSNTDSWASP